MGSVPPATIASKLLCIMDASGAVYPLFPNHVTPLAESPTNARQCSSRGCTLVVTGDLAHKMCDTCRSRSRIYASKKRAKRTTEKASSTICSVVPASGSETPLGTSEASPVLQECEWVITTQENYQVSQYFLCGMPPGTRFTRRYSVFWFINGV